MRRALRWTAGVVTALALVVSALVVWSVRRGFPQYSGQLSLTGLTARVTVYRDAYGVPQLHARSAEDLFKAQGYVTAQDRFWQMDYRRHLTSGRLAELFGDPLVPTDAFLRTLGWRRVAEREWALISPETRNYLRAYADGVNAWIAANGGADPAGKGLEYTLVGLQNSAYTVEKWDPVDSLAWLKAMAWELLGNMDAEIDRSLLLAHGLSRSQIEQLYPPYPYARNSPISGDSAFHTGVTAPAAYSRPGERLSRQAAPALAALGDTMRSLRLRPWKDPAGIGSNAWAVSGAHTASGKPMLANDPHLAASMPGTWYQVGMRCDCSYNVQGLSMPGVPGVVIGRNDRIAWGLTNLAADVTDLYLEKVKDNRYFDGTAWRDLTTRQEVIKVAGGRPVAITVRATRHGPLLSDRRPDMLGVAARPPIDPSGRPLSNVTPALLSDVTPGPLPSLDTGEPGVPAQAAARPYAVALRWTAFEPGRTMDALFAVNTAANWTQFRAAAALFDEPAQDMVYADVDGHIGYQAPGRIPIRTKGDGRWPVPGWDPAYDWKGRIPFNELPSVFDPPGGVIVTANHAVAGPEYSHLITADWTYGYRGQRILDLLAEQTARGKLDVAAVRRTQFDNRNGFAPVVVPALLAAPLGGDATVARARDLLKGWDFQQDADSPAAAFYNATWRHLLGRTFDELPEDRRPSGGDRWWEVVRPLMEEQASPWWNDRRTAKTESMNDILAAAMSDAAAELTDRLGADPAGWRWGDLHTLTLQGYGPGQSGIAPVEWLFNRGPVPIAGGSDAVNSTSWSAGNDYEAGFVPTARMIVDMSDLDGSRWIQLAGASGHAFHDNYGDQLDLWRTGRDTPMPWTRQRVEAAEHVLTLAPTSVR
ncbi:penicillin acylase family protein [Nonomuraea basaltis]|nr:penicillin acylase family protein [Nonomuraea basaltis]